MILGVALGSGAAGWLLGRRRARHSPHFPPSWLAAVALAGAAASAGVAALADRLVLPIGELVARHADDVPRLLDLQFLGTVAVLLLPALAFGATFPLAVAAASGPRKTAGRTTEAAGRATEKAGRATENAGRATGAIYGWTAGGNVVGAFAAGAVVIPSLGIEGGALRGGPRPARGGGAGEAAGADGARRRRGPRRRRGRRPVVGLGIPLRRPLQGRAHAGDRPPAGLPPPRPAAVPRPGRGGHRLGQGSGRGTLALD